VFEEQELSQPAVAGVGQRTLSAPFCDPGVDHLDGVGVQRHHAFGVELADRHPQPGAVAGEVQQAVQFQVEQFADAHAGGA
jgi:hypothetical protein